MEKIISTWKKTCYAKEKPRKENPVDHKLSAKFSCYWITNLYIFHYEVEFNIKFFRGGSDNRFSSLRHKYFIWKSCILKLNQLWQKNFKAAKEMVVLILRRLAKVDLLKHPPPKLHYEQARNLLGAVV